jgi:hypothetical protein
MMACKKDLQSNPSIGKLQSTVCGLILLLATYLYLSGFAWSSEMSVVSDEGTASRCSMTEPNSACSQNETRSRIDLSLKPKMKRPTEFSARGKRP